MTEKKRTSRKEFFFFSGRGDFLGYIGMVHACQWMGREIFLDRRKRRDSRDHIIMILNWMEASKKERKN
jgi:hypothetical protein